MHLRENFTNPPGASIHTPENRLFDMFHSGTQVEVKEEIIRYFKDPTSNLRIVIATIAFGLGIDCPNVRQVIHYGPPEDVESYVQHIGRAGRDNERSCSLLLHGPGLYRYTDEYLKDYCVKTDECRRDKLYKHFSCYKHASCNKGCMCCDFCMEKCKCGNCASNLETFFCLIITMEKCKCASNLETFFCLIITMIIINIFFLNPFTNVFICLIIHCFRSLLLILVIIIIHLYIL